MVEGVNKLVAIPAKNSAPTKFLEAILDIRTNVSIRRIMCGCENISAFVLLIFKKVMEDHDDHILLDKYDRKRRTSRLQCVHVKLKLL